MSRQVQMPPQPAVPQSCCSTRSPTPLLSRARSACYRDRKKGADGGVDGEILFLNGPRGVGRIIVSVKGGKALGVDAVRELRAVVDQQGADMGVLVSLADPSRDAVNAAVSAGVARTVHGEFPKLQLAPMHELFEGRRPRLPVPAPAALLRPPKGKKKKVDKQLNFTFAFGGHNYQRPASEDGVVLDPGLLVGRSA
ncbi:MAG TPA: restriction endonuclease [Sphingomonas sp.]|nr:restriction endonuclease [Sphingomonas sp.]